MIEQVRQFHLTFGVPVESSPVIPSAAIKELRKKLIAEECAELLKAIEEDNLVEIADGICDLHYVLSGTSLAYGLPEDALFAEVHRSNMSKAAEDGSVIRRADGKILKSARWSPPNLRGLL